MLVHHLTGRGPAIMATRTLENKRDRYLTVFMNPLMSCGARLPVYALFGVAFFGAAAGAMTFSLYVVGIGVAVLTGLLLRRTLFKGEPTYFVMELPPYHAPRLGSILRQSWRRLLVFMTRAKYIIPIVMVLAVLNSVGIDGTVGNEDSSKSVLSNIGRTITPVFEPMGVEQDNWPATVGVFTGIFAKEAVIGTLNSLYEQQDAAAATGEAKEEPFSFWSGIGEGFASVPEALAGVPATLVDPFGLGVVSGTQDVVAEEVGATVSVYAGLKAGFSQGPLQAYAYLLFILLYPPCVAALAAMTREIGTGYSLVSVVYLLVIAWAVATLFYQVALGGQLLWMGVAVGLIVLMVLMFWVLGRRSRRAEGRSFDVPGSTTMGY